MARPTKAKDPKPKAEDTEEIMEDAAPKQSIDIINIVIMALVIFLSTTFSSAASIYFLAPIVIKPLLSQITVKSGDAAGGEEGGGEAPAEPTIGPVIPLDEFTVNLKDTSSERYLRANISLSITADDPKFGTLTGEAAAKWQDEFKGEMSSYVPAIRDIVIASLTKRTAAELSTAIGKQELKDEIKQSVNGLLQGKHKVIRVNLENFIIQ
jgi:flagellar protein FliL